MTAAHSRLGFCDETLKPRPLSFKFPRTGVRALRDRPRPWPSCSSCRPWTYARQGSATSRPNVEIRTLGVGGVAGAVVSVLCVSAVVSSISRARAVLLGKATQNANRHASNRDRHAGSRYWSVGAKRSRVVPLLKSAARESAFLARDLPDAVWSTAGSCSAVLDQLPTAGARGCGCHPTTVVDCRLMPTLWGQRPPQDRAGQRSPPSTRCPTRRTAPDRAGQRPPQMGQRTSAPRAESSSPRRQTRRRA